MNNFFILDLPALLSLLLCSISCALVGAFMVLRRESLISDAISHSVLPGIIIAFYLVHDRNSLFIFLGAIIAAVSATSLISFLKEKFNVEQSSSTGVIFSIYFALGIVLIESLSASHIDLDVDCVLHGQLETILWSFPDTVVPFSFESLRYLPTEITQGIISLLAVGLFYLFFYNSFVIASFDKDFALSKGLTVSRIEFAYTSLVAIVAVSSFTVVGSILVIALMVCPAASARMCTDRLNIHVILTIAFSILASSIGYACAILVPTSIGFDNALSISGTVVCVSGVLLLASIVFSPRYGVLGRYIRTRTQKRKILEEDIIGFIYRYFESNGSQSKLSLAILEDRFANSTQWKAVFHALSFHKIILISNEIVTLTPSGQKRAIEVISKHRLWESFLVQEVGLKEDHVHPNAEIFEHIIDDTQHGFLRDQHGGNIKDPHGKLIPK